MMFQLIIKGCPYIHIEPISEKLEDFQALAVTLSDHQDHPILEPLPGETPLWDTLNIEAIFETEDLLHFARQTLQQNYPSLSMHYEGVPEKNWEKECLKQFVPLSFGKRLWIYPSWHDISSVDSVEKSGEVALDAQKVGDHSTTIIRLDPGLAFGTGTHPTTSLCLKWLDSAELTHQNVLDFGCGSGILGIAALKLGARHVTAVDIDPQALTATQDNATLNQIASSDLSLHLANQFKPDKSYDIILANILLGPLLTLRDTFWSLLTSISDPIAPKSELTSGKLYTASNGLKNKRLVVSGVYEYQAQQLIEHYQTHFEYLETTTETNSETWARLTFRPKLI